MEPRVKLLEQKLGGAAEMDITIRILTRNY